MDKTRFARIEELFHAAADRPEAARRAYLQAHENDPDIIAQVERLLSRSGSEQTALQAALSAAVAATGRIDPQIGPYRILSELGAGGMGAVFLAERLLGDTPQRVALKLIRGVPTTASRERLARERALLAELNHPNIARLIDAGETENGVPYLAMEYIEGAPLLAWCEKNVLDIPSRLRLFAQLCRAVQHAHQRLVVHRDIKPSNIVVRDDGTPVLLDFGIGKLLDPGTEDLTATQAFTPAYAAPEQREGLHVTTATDVFGLGCVLLELVSGRNIREIRQGDQIASASAAALHPADARALRGDIDTIVAEALQIEPGRRYASAQALADDVENYLHGRPLNAAPDGVAYRLRKFVARHRIEVLTTAVALLLICGLLWRLFVERNEALHHAQRAEVTRDFLVSLFRFADPNFHHGTPVNVRAMLDEGNKQLDKELSAEPALHAELSEALGQIYRDIGDDRQALAQFRRAVDLTSPEDDALVHARRIASVARMVLRDASPESTVAALPQLDHALELIADRNDDVALKLRLQLLSSRSLALAVTDHMDEAVATLHGSMTLVDKLREGREAQRANIYYDLAKLDAMRGENDLARDDAARAERSFVSAYGTEHPETIKAMEMHALLLAYTDDFAAAEAQYRKTLAAQSKVFPADSPHTASTAIALGDLLVTLHRPAEALPFFELARGHCLTDPKPGPPQGVPCFRVLRGTGEALVMQGDHSGVAMVRDAASKCSPGDAFVCTLTEAALARTLCMAGDVAGGAALVPHIDSNVRSAEVVGSLDRLRVRQVHELCNVASDAARP